MIDCVQLCGLCVKIEAQALCRNYTENYFVYLALLASHLQDILSFLIY
jgi:hypothetical protein